MGAPNADCAEAVKGVADTAATSAKVTATWLAKWRKEGMGMYTGRELVTTIRNVKKHIAAVAT
jgi:hypothetical protein